MSSGEVTGNNKNKDNESDAVLIDSCFQTAPNQCKCPGCQENDCNGSTSSNDTSQDRIPWL